MLETEILGLFVGNIKELWPNKRPTAIFKEAQDGPLKLEKWGFTSDQQADKRYHGGEDKAVHQYPQEHFKNWQNEFGENIRFKAGGFGENISTSGMTEHTLHVGDILSLGSAKVQITQGRQPCWKINFHTDCKNMALKMQETVRTGWYYRVLENGVVKKGDKISLLERINNLWSVHKLTNARLNKVIDQQDAKALSELSYLTDSWRSAFAKMAEGQLDERGGPTLSTSLQPC